MYRNILVPLDGSLVAESMLPYVVRLAVAVNSRVTLLYLADIRGSAGLPLVQRADLPAAVTPEVYLQQAVEPLEKEGIDTRYAIMAGPAAESIQDFAERYEHDLIAMATAGRGGLGRLLHRDTADDLLRLSHLPLFLLRPDESQPPHARYGAINTVVVPLDGSDVAEAALPHALGVARAVTARLLLVRAVSPAVVALAGPGDPFAYGHDPRQLDLLEAEALGYVTAKAEQIGASGVPVDSRVMIGSPAGAITEVANGAGNSLVVMSTHGRSGLMRIVLGSVAGQVVSLSRKPLLLVHPPAGA